MNNNIGTVDRSSSQNKPKTGDFSAIRDRMKQKTLLTNNFLLELSLFLIISTYSFFI